MLRTTFIIVIVFVALFSAPYALAAADYPWRVDESYCFSATRFETVVGFHTLWDHVLTYYPEKSGCEIYDAWNFHDMLFEVVMETTPEMEGGEGKQVVAYRAFWDGADVICTWTFYDDFASDELRSDSEAFDTNHVNRVDKVYSN